MCTNAYQTIINILKRKAMTKKQLRKEIRKLNEIIDIEVENNICLDKHLQSAIVENDILIQSLQSCENALHEKETIITYLETKGN